MKSLHWVGPTLATALYLALITALARTTGLSFLLFPELGALASVVFADPGGRWARAPVLLAITPVLTALLGVLITRLLPYGPLAVVLDLGICLLVIRALRSPIMPAISAGILPLALGITSWMYPLAILAGTGGLALLVVLRASLAPSIPTAPILTPAPPVAVPLPGPNRLAWFWPLAAFLAGALVLVQLLGSHLVLYPPLLVIAWDMLADRDHCPWLGRPLAVLVVTGGAAVAGLALAGDARRLRSPDGGAAPPWSWVWLWNVSAFAAASPWSCSQPSISHAPVPLTPPTWAWSCCGASWRPLPWR